MKVKLSKINSLENRAWKQHGAPVLVKGRKRMIDCTKTEALAHPRRYQEHQIPDPDGSCPAAWARHCSWYRRYVFQNATECGQPPAFMAGRGKKSRQAGHQQARHLHRKMVLNNATYPWRRPAAACVKAKLASAMTRTKVAHVPCRWPAQVALM